MSNIQTKRLTRNNAKIRQSSDINFNKKVNIVKFIFFL